MKLFEIFFFLFEHYTTRNKFKDMIYKLLKNKNYNNKYDYS